MDRRTFATLSSLCVASFLTLGVAQSQTLSPITVTGFNLDPIHGDNPNVPANGNPENFQGFTFAAIGQGSVSSGLPANGKIVSQGNPNATFQLAPYTSNDVLTLEGNSNGNPNGLGATNTLTLASPASYGTVGILMAVAGTGGGTFTFNFSDGTSLTDTIAALPYWQANAATDAADGAIYAGPLQLYQNVAVNFNEYDFILPMIDQAKLLSSVTMTFTPEGTATQPTGTLGIFALSGDEVPEPSTYAMLLLGVLAFVLFVRRNGAVTD